MSEQAVIINFKYTASDLGALHDLEDKLTEAIEEAGEGECDGHDITPDLAAATIYLYGPEVRYSRKSCSRELKKGGVSC